MATLKKFGEWLDALNPNQSTAFFAGQMALQALVALAVGYVSKYFDLMPANQPYFGVLPF